MGAGGGGGAYKPISEKEWKELAKDLKYPPDCEDLYKLGRFLQAHGGIAGENRRLGDEPIPPGGERSETSWHYKCGNSGAIDLNYAGNEKAIIDSQIGWFHKLGFNTLWQVYNHFDHVHINPGAGEGVGGSGGGAAGPAAAHGARGQADRLGRGLPYRVRGRLRGRRGRHPVRARPTPRSPRSCATSSTA